MSGTSLADRTGRAGLPPTRPFLDVRDLRVQFPTDDGLVKAVDGLSFHVERGRTLGIVGESGSGKSVTSLAILGLHRRADRSRSARRAAATDTAGASRLTGEILLDGEDLLAQDAERVRSLRGKRMAMIFQDPLSAMHPYYTVGQQIIEAYRIHNQVSTKVARQHAIDMLGRVGIPEPARRVDAYPHHFSGGMRQRAMIAIALSLNPPLMIMDEPTTALDVVVQKEIMQQINELKERLGFSIIFITHDLSLLVEISDRIAIMYAGQIVELAEARELFDRPLHPYTQGLMRSFPSLTGERHKLTGIAGSPPDLVSPPSGCRFHPRCPKRMDGCERLIPPLMQVEPGHWVSCHLYPDGGEHLRTGENPRRLTGRGTNDA